MMPCYKIPIRRTAAYAGMTVYGAGMRDYGTGISASGVDRLVRGRNKWHSMPGLLFTAVAIEINRNSLRAESSRLFQKVPGQ